MAEYEAFRDTGTPQGLRPCYNCGRTFNPDTLGKHEKVCSKLKDRKVFDSSKQRVQGSEAARMTKRPDPPPAKGRDKSNWKVKHQNLIATLKAARGDGPPVAAVIDPGYVECQYCNRNFNEYAAERHIPFCKEQQARIHSNSSKAKSKLVKRTQYKPPLPGAKKSSSSSLASDSTPVKKPTPSRVPTSSSAGIQKRSPAASPGIRRRISSDPSDLVDARVTRRQPAASPPPQQRQLGATRTLDKNRASSGSSSDSDAIRGGSGRTGQDPAWFKDMQKTESPSILPEKQPPSNSKRNSGRNRETSARDVFDFDEKPTRQNRRTELDSEDHSGPISKPTAVGVVRPSSRKLHEKEERTNSGRTRLANFCHQCGTKYPVSNARFCCECGLKRAHVEVQ